MKKLMIAALWLCLPLVTNHSPLFAQCGPNGCPQPRGAGQQRLALPAAGFDCPFNCSANCVNGVCVSATCPSGCPAGGGYTWLKINDSPQWALYAGLEQVGNYDEERDVYCRYFKATKTWGQPESPPIAKPISKRPEAEKKVEKEEAKQEWTDENGRKFLFGVVPDPHDDGKPKYRFGGEEVSREELYQQIDKRVKDRSEKLWLTVIGADAVRRRVVDDLKNKAELQPLLNDFRTKDYDPADWQVARSGFYTGGAPTIYVQAPNGKVLHRQDNYAGPDELAETLRKANEQYKREADPNLSRVTIGLLGLPLEAWLVIAVIVYFIAQPRKGANS